MKRKVLTFTLIGLLAVGSIVPLTAKALESWNYGYNKSTMQWYNEYYHSQYRHYGTITRNGFTYAGPIAIPGSWSNLYIDYNGPYLATYDKYIIR